MTNRYARQIVLPEIGEDGQKILSVSSVLCIGAGGLGSPALQYLAAAGVGRIGIVDDDTVDKSNLQRQVIFTEADNGKSKAECAAEALRKFNSEIKYEVHKERFSAANAENLIKNYDVIIDGSDNFSSKFLINDSCVKFGKTLVYASILGFDAQVSVFWGGHSACYRCLYPAPPKGHIPNCAEAGVIGAVAGIAGTVQAHEAIKMMLGPEFCKSKGLEPLLGKLWVMDARTMESRKIAIPKRADCKVCGIPPEKIILSDGEGAQCSTPLAIDSLSAEKMLGKATFIDVREAHELASGKIKGATHIPLGQLVATKEELDLLPQNASIIVYCQHGIRSLTGANHLKSLGYQNVSHLAGGIVRWSGATE